jgi:hypothetical protein
VNAFEYFDEKNRDRVFLVKEKLTEMKTNMIDLRSILELVKLKVTKNEINI